ncbi:MAG: hypothetical protein AB7O32_09435 [Vicinamibacterales bacterium]
MHHEVAPVRQNGTAAPVRQNGVRMALVPKRTVSIYHRFTSAGRVSLAALRTLAILLALALGAAAASAEGAPASASGHPSGCAAAIGAPRTTHDLDPATPDWSRLGSAELVTDVLSIVKAPCRDDGFTEPCDEEESDESDSNDEGLHAGLTIADAESSAPHACHHVRPSSSTSTTGRSPRAPPVPSSLV